MVDDHRTPSLNRTDINGFGDRCSTVELWAWTRRPVCSECWMTLVGSTGFEPVAFCSQSRRATKLRYDPFIGEWSCRELNSGLICVCRIAYCYTFIRCLFFSRRGAFGNPVRFCWRCLILVGWVYRHTVRLGRLCVYHAWFDIGMLVKHVFHAARVKREEETMLAFILWQGW